MCVLLSVMIRIWKHETENNIKNTATRIEGIKITYQVQMQTVLLYLPNVFNFIDEEVHHSTAVWINVFVKSLYSHLGVIPPHAENTLIIE